jgi:hypothetical protein
MCRRNQTTSNQPTLAARARRYAELAAHHGHEIQIVIYGGDANAAVECETCHMVLLDFDRAADANRDADHAVLLALAERHRLPGRDLDEAVLDAMCDDGATVNNQGLADQLSFLLAHDGVEATRQTIEGLASNRRGR